MRTEVTDHRRDLMFYVFVAAAVLLGALMAAKVVSLLRVQRVVAQVRTLGRDDPNDLQKCLREAREIADGLKKGNLFVKRPPKEHPVKQVDGILGSEAFIGGKWYKAGQKVGDAKIIAVKPTEVVVEWEGKTKTFSPMAAEESGPSPRPDRSRPEMPKGPEPPKDVTQAEPAEAKAAPAPVDDDPLAWMGVTLSAKARAMLLEHWNKMSDEEKEKAQQEWNNMSDEQKQQAAEAMEQHL